MKQSILIALASALIAGAAIKAAPAFAEQPGSPETRVSIVRTGDLDLRSEAGQRALRQRLALAAKEVCGTASDADVEGKNDVLQCRRDALARASTQRDQMLAANRGGGILAVTANR